MNFGYIAQFAAMATGVIAVALYFYNFNKADEKILKYGNYFLIGQIILTTLASAFLLYNLIIGNFRLEYVAQYTDKSLPLIYKMSAFWAGQAGSLLFWGWLVNVFVAFELVRIKKYNPKYQSAVFFTAALTTTFFLVLTNFVTNPFNELPFMRSDGLGMNPLLQNPGMIYHPPTLYLGFVGVTFPLAHAVASLVVNDLSNYWVKSARVWSIIGWIFLTIGIVLGGQWAYVELGWGGYWAWDPVENASLLPWFTLTAFIHSSVMYEKLKKLKIWTYFLAILSFELAILGTFITRSGVIDSVHSFGKSSLGAFFMWFMGATTIAFLVLLFRKYKELKEKQHYSLISKEGLFFMANWLFFGTMFVVLFGTTLPMFSELFFGDKTSVGIPYYNRVTTPFFMGILVLGGLAPLMSYGSSSFKDIIKKQWPAIIFMVIATAGFYSLGYTKITPLILFAFTSFSFFIILMQMWKLIRTSGFSFFLKNKRFTGGLITHLGVTIISFGVITSAFYKHQTEEVVMPGDKIKLAGYELVAGNLVVEKEVNYLSIYVPTKVYKNGKYIVTMKPEKRFYNNNENAFAEVAIRTTGLGDLYLIFSSFKIPKSEYPLLDSFYSSSNKRMVIDSEGLGMQVVYEPFIVWIWIGCFIMVFGGFYGLFGRKQSE